MNNSRETIHNVYFPGLNGLRFLAAFLVIINHVESSKFFCGYSNGMEYPLFTAVGGLSVTLFFVLSGFLITYLLLDEKNKTERINVQRFYFKRIARIWPLYFLIIALALGVWNYFDFFDIPKFSTTVYDHIGAKLILYALILPNVVMAAFGGIQPYTSHLCRSE